MLVERTTLALLGYIETSEDGFRILVRDSPVAQATGTFSSLIGDVATQVEHMLADQFKKQGQDPKTAPIYAQMLVGMVALTGQWWLDARSPSKNVGRGAPGEPRVERAVGARAPADADPHLRGISLDVE